MNPQIRFSSTPELNSQPFPGPAGIEATLFPPTSRHHGIKAQRFRRADGREVAYLQRRFLPAMEAFEDLREHVVAQGDRLDNLAWQYIGDAEMYWRICDANGAMHPEELTAEAGRRLRITLPEGIPGAPRA
jgi:hypothetical protein